MPKYTFKCSSCDKQVQKYVNSGVTNITCDGCSDSMNRLIPIINKPTVTEVADSYMGIALPQDNAEIISERKSDYYWAVVVPQLCREYSVEHCLENKWAYYNEKGEYCIHTKPPSKR